jgi:ABC-type transporter Mla subunit MlaD
MAAPNLFEELKTVLNQFKEFLAANVDKIKPAVAPLDQLTGGRVTELINKLIDLMNKLKAEVDKLDPNLIPNLGEVTQFTQSVKSLLETSKNLLPDEADTINDILGVADIVTSLPSVEQLKDEIKTLIDTIITHLNSLKA